jgi:hypothetical protein
MIGKQRESLLRQKGQDIPAATAVSVRLRMVLRHSNRFPEHGLHRKAKFCN